MSLSKLWLICMWHATHVRQLVACTHVHKHQATPLHTTTYAKGRLA